MAELRQRQLCSLNSNIPNAIHTIFKQATMTLTVNAGKIVRCDIISTPPQIQSVPDVSGVHNFLQEQNWWKI